MKQLFTFLMTFAALAVIFSAMTGCGGAEQNSNAVVNTTANNAFTQKQTSSTGFPPPASGTSANAAATNTFTQKQTNSIEYPPLASGLADAEVEMLDGSKFKISDKKGKVLLVNIWGTWCGPCISEMPHLIELQNKHGGQGFEVIGLNIGDGSGSPEPLDDIKEFAARQRLNYTIAIASNAVTNQFYLITKQQVVPQTILVDREGKLRGVFIGGGPRIFNSMKENVAKVMAES